MNKPGWTVLSNRDSKLKTHEFLPAAIEILETPASPLKHWLPLGICLFFSLLLLWLWFGQIDVVVEGVGRVIPDGHIKPVSSIQVARINRLLVAEGTQVQKGQPLVALTANPTDLETVKEQPGNDIMSARLTLLRTAYLLELAEQPESEPLLLQLRQGAEPEHFPVLPSSQRWNSENQALRNELDSYRAEMRSFDERIQALNAILSADSDELMRLELLLPIHNKLANDSKQLFEKKMLSEVDWLTRREKQIETLQLLSAARNHRLEHQAQLQMTLSEKRQKHKDFLFRSAQLQLEAQQRLDQALEILEKARQRESNLFLIAPVSGTVQQLQVFSEGDVVQPSQPVMMIVPGDVHLEIEARVENKDIRWLETGLEVQVKVDAFPYTRHGHLSGSIRHISLDAQFDEHSGWQYPVYIRIDQPWFMINDHRHNLRPGMTVTTDVIVGNRRLLEFFLSPLLRYQKESFREAM